MTESADERYKSELGQFIADLVRYSDSELKTTLEILYRSITHVRPEMRTLTRNKMFFEFACDCAHKTERGHLIDEAKAEVENERRRLKDGNRARLSLGRRE